MNCALYIVKAICKGTLETVCDKIGAKYYKNSWTRTLLERQNIVKTRVLWTQRGAIQKDHGVWKRDWVSQRLVVTRDSNWTTYSARPIHDKLYTTFHYVAKVQVVVRERLCTKIILFQSDKALFNSCRTISITTLQLFSILN